MSQTVLIVEDEKEIADTLTYALASESFKPKWVSNCEQAKSAFNDTKFDICLLDVGLPDGSGFELLKSLRELSITIPVIFLTARNEEIDRIVGLEIGADDYICKPFSPREVVTRVKVILKRLSKQQNSLDARSAKSVLEKSIDTEQISFEHKTEQKLIYLGGERLDLTRAEYQLLCTFLEHPSRVFSRRQLINGIWSDNHPSDDRAIDTHIKTLRAKLKPHNPHKEVIITHRGFGYSLEL